MTEKEVRRAYKSLCACAIPGGEYHPENCQKCESPCKYGTRLLRHNGLERLVEKETPEEKAANMNQGVKRYARGYNKYSIARR